MGSALTTRRIKAGGEWITTPTPRRLPLPLSPTLTPKPYRSPYQGGGRVDHHPGQVGRRAAAARWLRQGHLIEEPKP